MKKIIDIATVILLAAAFILAYYTGFVSRTATGEPVLATGTLALISVIGVTVLFGVGGAATAHDRLKRGNVTKSFLALFIVEIFALVGMFAIIAALMLKMFTIDNTIIRALYVIFSMVCVIGYVDAMLYSDSMAAKDAAKNPDEEDEDDEENHSEAYNEIMDEIRELEAELDAWDEETGYPGDDAE